jgi:adenylosuccinate lyase
MIVQQAKNRRFNNNRKTNVKHLNVRTIQSSLKPLLHPLSELTAVSPIDGRYSKNTAGLRDILSEYGLIKKRVEVEIRWLQHMSVNVKEIKEVPTFTGKTMNFLNTLVADFCIDDANEIKRIEQAINHDVKAVEYWIKKKILSSNIEELANVIEFVHFGCTSEDINNLSHGLMIKEALRLNVLPLMDWIIQDIGGLSLAYAHIPMLSRTHGQPASPTTMGKEMAVFAYRLNKEKEKLESVVINGKMAGAVGNYNAHQVVYKDVDWTYIAHDFINKMGLSHNPYVTQIEPHDYIAELFHCIIRFNNILVDFNRDVWGYISLGYFKQKVVGGEVGSSTMPHKVNPIDFENSEGNLGMSNAILEHMASKLVISRWQRDLTDSTVLRNLGVCLGYSVIAYSSVIKGIQKLRIDENKLMQDLDDNWEVLAEPIQMVLRKYGVRNSYELLKDYTRRNDKVSQESMMDFITKIEGIPPSAKFELKNLKPWTYIGNAGQQAQNIVNDIKTKRY